MGRRIRGSALFNLIREESGSLASLHMLQSILHTTPLETLTMRIFENLLIVSDIYLLAPQFEYTQTTASTWRFLAPCCPTSFAAR